MNYILHLEKLVAEHKAAVKKYDYLIKQLLELDPDAKKRMKHQKAVGHMKRLGRRMGLKRKGRVHSQNGGSIKATILKAAKKINRPFAFKDLTDSMLNNGFKTTSTNPTNLIGVELRKLMKAGFFSKTGKVGSYTYTLRKAGDE